MDPSKAETLQRLAEIQALLLQFRVAPTFDTRMRLNQELVWARRKVGEQGCLQRILISDEAGRQRSIDIFDRFFVPPPGEDFAHDVICMIEATKRRIDAEKPDAAANSRVLRESRDAVRAARRG